MARRSKLSRDQKRKQKLAKRRRPEDRIQPYQGNQYKTAEYVEPLMRAEVGIYESYVMSERQLTDRDVERSIESLVLELRHQKPAAPARHLQTGVGDDEGEDLTIWRIKANWDDLFASSPRPADSDLAGILRTILGSVKTWSRPGPGSQGYLKYIEGFLGKMGVRVQALPGDAEGIEAGDEASDEDVLRELGVAWVSSGDPAAKREFLDEAQDLLEAGQAGVVVETCQWLIGTAGDRATVYELQGLFQAASKHQPRRLT